MITCLKGAVLMPVIFNETNFELYRNLLLENGLELAKQGGLKNIRVENVTKRAGLAKGTFYTFFPSKEEFIYEISVYNRNKAKKYFADLTSGDTLLGRKEAKEFFIFLLLSENNIYTYLTQEDYAYLRARWPIEYSLNAEADEKTSTWLLSKMKAKTDCNWKLLANYMKAITFVTMEKNMLHQDVYKETILLLVDGMVDYIFGKE